MCALQLLLFLVVFWTAEVGASDPTLPFMEYLDRNHLVCIKWGFDNQDGDITFTFVVNTTGWVGFGFSPNGGMQGADIVMGGVGSSEVYFKDYYATGNSMPKIDEKQSYALLSARESEGQTILTFKRAIQSCDDQDYHIGTGAIKLIYAYGQTDEINYHGSLRGTMEVNLLNYMSKATTSGLNCIGLRVDNFTVPEIQTYYHCKVIRIQKLYRKSHIVMVAPVIENPDLVHHMLLYRCPSFVTEEYDNPCYQGDIGDACFDIVASWAVGGGVLVLPGDVGIPIGGGEVEFLYRLEIHYSNPQGYKGKTDSSGLELCLTDKLRPKEAAIMSTGILHFGDMEYKIPPNAPKFHTYGVCNTSLFSQVENSVPDLQVFAVLLHTHLAGRKIRAVQFRNGVQVDILAMDNDYNFEYQQATTLGTTKTIKPGDELVVECTYSTSNRTKATKLGLGTYDEMCLAFLFYYPATNITTCISHPLTMHPLLSTSNQLFDETSPGEEEIIQYEHLLRTVPQIQLVSTKENNYSVYENGLVRELSAPPTITCRSSNKSSRLGTSWILNTEGVLMFLLLIAVM